MSAGVPKIDRRTAADVAAQTRAYLFRYLGSRYHWPENSTGGEAGEALTGIFARYCELIIERLNQAPDKNLLAFLDLLGNSLIPAQPARTRVTLALDSGCASGLLLPAATRFQAAPPAGSSEPIFFESESDAWLAALDLVAVKRAAPAGADLSALINNPDAKAAAEKMFGATTLSPYLFCLASRPALKAPAQSPVALHFWLDSPRYDPDQPAASAIPPLPLAWEWSADGSSNWRKLLVEDDTSAMTRSGSVVFIAPADDGWTTQGKSRRFWVRVNPPSPAYLAPPSLRCVALNTVAVVQAVTIEDEVLGSSNGNSGQSFATLRKPVMDGQQLEILEQASTSATAGSAATMAIANWVAWQEVSDFHGSRPGDRHYLLNHQTGQLRFGDGQRGMIPARGARNVRMTRYRAGGGVAGNVAAGAISTLMAASKQIARIGNLFAATGGSVAEEPAALRERAPKKLRHRERAVTQEDYQDLAELASGEVARALCVPLQDLRADPYKLIRTIDDEKAGVGHVSVIIVPGSGEPKPLPSPDLMQRVQAYLAERASAGVAIAVVGALYLSANISVSVYLSSLMLQNQVESELLQRLSDFLHPLTGNGGSGWPFGRRPYESDLYALIANVPGVAYVANLAILLDADNDSRLNDIIDTGRFLIYSGNHTLHLELAS